MTKITPPISDLQRLADLPELINNADRRVLGMKANRDKLKRSMDATEARLRLSEKVKSEKNAEDRAAALLLALEDDPKHQANVERLDELTATIRKVEAERDMLRRERDGLQTTIIARSTAQWKEILADQKFAEMVGTKALA